MNLTSAYLANRNSYPGGPRKQSGEDVSDYAGSLFNASLNTGLARFFRRSRLQELSQVLSGRKIVGQHALGIRQIPLAAIKGSEGRCLEFDGSFRPLQEHTRYRWLKIATAREEGKPLPPVELIQVDEQYFVRDGHHRISVAAALGQKEIEAEVTVYLIE